MLARASSVASSDLRTSVSSALPRSSAPLLFSPWRSETSASSNITRPLSGDFKSAFSKLTAASASCPFCRATCPRKSSSLAEAESLPLSALSSTWAALAVSLPAISALA